MRWDVRMWLADEERAYEMRQVRAVHFSDKGCTVEIGDSEVTFDANPVEAFVVECIHDEHESPIPDEAH